MSESLLKKEFKQMYNYSKEIVEKLHLLNNAIKVEESAILELNSIKHLVRNLSESFTKWKLLALSKVKSSENVID